MCREIDRYIQKFIQEKGHGKYLLNIQIKEPIDEFIPEHKQLSLPLDNMG